MLNIWEIEGDGGMCYDGELLSEFSETFGLWLHSEVEEPSTTL